MAFDDLSRTDAFDAFLADTRWAKTMRDPLPADASFRRYTRLFDMQRGDQALVMDAPPDVETKTKAFVRIAEILQTNGLSAPKIEKVDFEQGFVLLEDFGQGSFTAILQSELDREEELYRAACDVILSLEKIKSAPDVGHYDKDALARELELFCDWWWPSHASGEMPRQTRRAFWAAWGEPLAFLSAAQQSRPALTLRDFHKDNLFFLPARTGQQRVGLIDFQDALVGHAAYDAVSLLQDVRRDVTLDVQRTCFDMLDQRLDDPDFGAAYAAYGVQRALKILGIFVRLDRRDGKPHYREHLPRTWARVRENVDHPLMHSVRQWLVENQLGEGQ